MQFLKQSILATLLYSDVFRYPLTIGEIRTRLILTKLSDNNWQDELKKNLRQISGVQKKNEYYFVKGSISGIVERKIRQKYSLEKIRLAQKYTRILRIVPTVELVALTGALAVEFGTKNDDIDLLIVTKPGYIWTTRFFMTVLYEILGIRRHPNEKSYSGKLCLNMYLDTQHLEILTKEQNLYTAYELMQMKILWERNDTFRKILKENSWVRKFLPNAWTLRQSSLLFNRDFTNNRYSFISPIEYFFKHLQLRYMKKKRTSEVIRDGVIQFHPDDAGKRILRLFKEKCRRYNLKLPFRAFNIEYENPP
ncbi:hypothetical protein HYW55_04975 [Candidatus Gottesmanbacteria bacterium]|nr:hypothetical protein [Candidatus Gottesmanbacteria bacterium]